MALYYLVFLKLENGTASEIGIHCCTDDQAIIEARKRADGRTVMVWRGLGDRLVGVLDSSGTRIWRAV